MKTHSLSAMLRSGSATLAWPPSHAPILNAILEGTQQLHPQPSSPRRICGVERGRRRCVFEHRLLGPALSTWFWPSTPTCYLRPLCSLVCAMPSSVPYSSVGMPAGARVCSVRQKALDFASSLGPSQTSKTFMKHCPNSWLCGARTRTVGRDNRATSRPGQGQEFWDQKMINQDRKSSGTRR